MDRSDLLTECPSCKKKISIRAKKCPKCDTEFRFEEQPQNYKTTEQKVAFSQKNIPSNENHSVIHFDFAKSAKKSKKNLLKKVVFAISTIVILGVLIIIWKIY